MKIKLIDFGLKKDHYPFRPHENDAGADVYMPYDSGYRGEIHAIISNVSSESQILRKDTRIGQLVITPVLIADFVLDLGEARDTGAFGSTGE